MRKCKVILSTILMIALVFSGNIYTNIDNKVAKAEEIEASTSNVVNLSEKTFDLKSGNYIITTDGTAKVYQILEDGNYDEGIMVNNGHKLTTAGKYKIEKTEKGITYIQNIELYNGNGENKANKLLGNKIAIGGFDGPYSNGWSTNKVENGLDELPTDDQGYLNYVEDDVFKLISELGINVITWRNCNYSEGVQARNAVTQGLELADKYGIGMYVTDSSYLRDSSWTFDGIFSETNLINRIKYYSTYPSFLGINLVDEPVSDRYATTSKKEEYNLKNYSQTSKIISSFTNLTSYMNLFPLQDSLKTTPDAKNDYVKYLEEALESGVDVLSFDKYPFYEKTTKYTDATGNNTIMGEYFENLRLVRDYAKKYNKPFWTYIQAGCDFRDVGDKSPTSDKTKDTPTESEMLWNINTCLAYGTKGIQYFPLIQPFYYAYNGTDYDFERTGLIGADGKTKTQWYEYAKKANKHINAISDVLVNSTQKAIVINQIPEKRINNQLIGNLPKEYISDSRYSYNSLSSVTVNADKVDIAKSLSKYYGAIVGCFDYNGKDAYYVVNYNTKDNNEITLNLNGNYTVNIIQNAEKTVKNGRKITLNLGSGEGVLVEIVSGKADPTSSVQTTTKPTTNVKTPGKTKVTKVSKKYKDKKVKISLKKIATANRYEVQFSTIKNFKKVLYKKTVKKNAVTLSSKKLQKKKKLYVRARAIKVMGKKKYIGKWSSVKKVSVKLK